MKSQFSEMSLQVENDGVTLTDNSKEIIKDVVKDELNKWRENGMRNKLRELIDTWTDLQLILTSDDTTDHDICKICNDQVLMCGCQQETANEIMEILSVKSDWLSLLLTENSRYNHPDLSVVTTVTDERGGLTKEKLIKLILELSPDKEYIPVSFYGEGNNDNTRVAHGFIDTSTLTKHVPVSFFENWSEVCSSLGIPETITDLVHQTLNDTGPQYHSLYNTSDNLYTVYINTGENAPLDNSEDGQ